MQHSSAVSSFPSEERRNNPSPIENSSFRATEAPTCFRWRFATPVLFLRVQRNLTIVLTSIICIKAEGKASVTKQKIAHVRRVLYYAKRKNSHIGSVPTRRHILIDNTTP